MLQPNVALSLLCKLDNETNEMNTNTYCKEYIHYLALCSAGGGNPRHACHHWHVAEESLAHLHFILLLLLKISPHNTAALLLLPNFFALYSVLGISSQRKYD